MIEKVYKFNDSEEKLVEKLVDDENTVINHIVLPKHTGLPQHVSNSKIYLIIIRGSLTVELNNAEANTYKAGHIVNVPYKTNMFINNYSDEVTEFFIVKAPNPRAMD